MDLCLCLTVTVGLRGAACARLCWPGMGACACGAVPPLLTLTTWCPGRWVALTPWPIW